MGGGGGWSWPGHLLRERGSSLGLIGLFSLLRVLQMPPISPPWPPSTGSCPTQAFTALLLVLMGYAYVHINLLV